MLRAWSTVAGILPLCIGALAQSSLPPDIIRVPVRLVTAPTLVFSREGRLVPGLEKSNFQLFDNGRPQRVDLDPTVGPVSVVLAVQENRDVRSYLPFIARVGSVVEALLVGETGEAAVIAYNSDVQILKPFGAGDVQTAMRKIAPSGVHARMFDAAERAIALLKVRPAGRARVLVLIGQPMDSGSETDLAALRKDAEREYISIYTLTLPEFGRAFVSDTFSLEGLSSTTDRGGFKAGVDLGQLIAVLDRSSVAGKHADPFTILAGATGGTQIRFRKQAELEGALAAIGVELRSFYILSYSPNPAEPGYHTISVQVDKEGARTYSRPGYWLPEN
jgi:VWFA-related protein